jgi:hypothetical protein
MTIVAAERLSDSKASLCAYRASPVSPVGQSDDTASWINYFDVEYTAIGSPY